MCKITYVSYLGSCGYHECMLNPDSMKHEIYDMYGFSDRYRVDMTRFRLSSHRLKVETGRWSRIEKNLRLCSCSNQVQDEFHVLNNCDISHNLRTEFNQLNFNIPDIFESDPEQLTRFFHNLLKLYT